MGTREVAVRLAGINKRYGDVVAVADLDLQIPRATIYGLLGPNGAGKTTTLRIILDIIGADSGSVEVLGGQPTPAIRDRIGYLPEERGLYPRMRVRELLVFLAALKGTDRTTAAQRASSWLARLELDEWSGRRIEELSRGMQQKVQFIATVLHEPELLILDEPFSGLDPLNVDTLKDIVLEQKRRGAAVLFSTHNMDQAERLCDRVAMIKDARVVLDGPLAELRRRAWAEGTRAVQLALEGADGYLEASPLVVDVEERGTHRTAVLREGADPQELLEGALRAGARVHRFEVSEPSLHDIFVSVARG